MRGSHSKIFSGVHERPRYQNQTAEVETVLTEYNLQQLVNAVGKTYERFGLSLNKTIIECQEDSSHGHSATHI